MYQGTPYVYIVMNRTTKLKYIGVRYANGCHPSDLWNAYSTSSKLVHKLIETFGKQDFYVRVLHTFPSNPKEAILKEASYFPLIKKRADYLNMCYSSGIQDLRIASKGGKVGGAIVKAKKLGIFKEGANRKEWASNAGKASWQSDNNPKFKYWASKEGRKERSSRGGKNGHFSTNFLMRKYSCTKEEALLLLKKEQQQRGKRGGAKNKGFRWYNDGINTFKYTTQQQASEDFETFLLNNTQYKQGRLKKVLTNED